ncbi:diacylglycerol kinase, putative, partial [Eimeria tenella]
LRNIVEHCMRATVVYHDLWSVKVTLKPGGHFNRINSTTRKKEVVEAEGEPVKELSFTMSNYFSMGVESRIGRGFDRYRTKSQVFNKMRYGIEGFKKTFVTRTKSINEIILDLRIHPNTPEEQTLFTTDKAAAKAQQLPLLNSKMAPKAAAAAAAAAASALTTAAAAAAAAASAVRPAARPAAAAAVRSVSSSSPTHSSSSSSSSSVRFACAPAAETASLVVLNIPSFSGGNDIWAPSKKLATRMFDKQKQKQNKELLKVPQQMGDEKLEFMTFKNIPSLGMEF